MNEPALCFYDYFSRQLRFKVASCKIPYLVVVYVLRFTVKHHGIIHKYIATIEYIEAKSFKIRAEMENGHQTATQKKIMVHHNPGKLRNPLQYKEKSNCAIVAQERKLFKQDNYEYLCR
jgi:hypothetical protein